MAAWLAINRALYGARYRWQARAALRAGAALRLPQSPAENRDSLLHVAWGRIGDAVLGTATLAHFRAAFPGLEIVHLGRTETRPIVAPFVDRFIPLEKAPTLLGSSWRAIVSDVHLFYGGVFELDAVLASLRSEHRLLYEGYHRGPGLAPLAHVPDGFEVVPAVEKDERDPRARHVLLDQVHLLREATLRVRGLPFPIERPTPQLALELEPRADMADAVAFQPFSNNPKKDYPSARWRQVLAAFPDVRFVALGDAASAAAVDAIGATNVENLCGRTDLVDACAIIASARGFVGPDSGLAHVAAALRRPTVCIAQSANLGYFFPYPEELGFDWLQVIDHPDFRECSGCFMTCEHESIAATARRGAKCVREIPAGAITEVLHNALLRVAPVA